MGGMGSGVPAGESAKGTTEEAHRIDAAYLNRQDLLRPGHVGTLSWRRGERRTGWISFRVREDHLLLVYTADGEPLEYPVRLSRTPCHFGGTRTWLHCPADGCGRRVRVLYGGRLFVCRQCARLAYQSTREDRIDLATRRGNRIRRRLGWPEGMLNGTGRRPAGMHATTYRRLADESERHERDVLRGIATRFGFGDEPRRP